MLSSTEAIDRLEARFAAGGRLVLHLDARTDLGIESHAFLISCLHAVGSMLELSQEIKRGYVLGVRHFTVSTNQQKAIQYRLLPFKATQRISVANKRPHKTTTPLY